MAVSQERTLTPVPVNRGPPPDARRVLVVEPTASTRGLMQFGLVRAGFQVTSARSAEEAERALDHGPIPALVVSETRLPGLDGFVFCSRLRRSSLAEVPVLLLTSQPSESAIAQALAAGAHDVLAKPLFVGDLVSLARLESSRAPGSPTLVASTREVPVAAALRALLAGTRSGRLVLGATAELLFRDGKVVSAQVRALQGERALRRMLFLGEGAYAVHLGSVRSPGELSVDLRALCGPWTEALGGWRALARVSVPLEAVLCPDLRSLLAQIAQLPEEVEPVVRLFDGERTVRAVVLESSLPESLVLQVTNRLYASGALLPARAARARGLEPMPQRVRTGWDDPVPRSITPAVPWPTGETPAPTLPPAPAPTLVESVIPGSGAPTPVRVVAETPGVPAWGSYRWSARWSGRCARSRSGSSRFPRSPHGSRRRRRRGLPPAVRRPRPRRCPGCTGRPRPRASRWRSIRARSRRSWWPLAASRWRRPPRSSMRRPLLIGGLAVLGAAFLGTTLWVRVGAPSRDALPRVRPSSACRGRDRGGPAAGPGEGTH